MKGSLQGNPLREIPRGNPEGTSFSTIIGIAECTSGTNKRIPLKSRSIGGLEAQELYEHMSLSATFQHFFLRKLLRSVDLVSSISVRHILKPEEHTRLRSIAAL